MRRDHDEATARLAVASEELAAIMRPRSPELSRRAEFCAADLVSAVRAGRTGQRDRADRERTRPASRRRAADGRHTDPDELEAEAQQVEAAEQQLLAELAATRTRLDAARAELADRERQAAEAEQAHLAAVQAEADRREGLARLAGQVGDDAGACRIDRRQRCAAVRTHRGGRRPRAKQAKAEFETVQGRVGELDQGEVGLDEHHERTVAALRLADERVAELQAGERGAERQVASLRARIDALSVGLERKDGAAWLTQNRSSAGLFGSVAKLVKVQLGL